MVGICSATRLAITIGIVCAAILWLAADTEILPSPRKASMDGRVDITKSIAVSLTSDVRKNQTLNLDQKIKNYVNVLPQLSSIGLKRSNGKYSATTENHELNWSSDMYPDMCRVEADIRHQDKVWGTLQILFVPDDQRVASSYYYPLRGIFFIFAMVALSSWLILSQTFRYLNPSKVVPSRVRSALDTLTEGLVLIDPNGEIVHSNSAFTEIVGIDPDDLIGMELNQFEWNALESDDNFPWNSCFEDQKQVRGKVLECSSEKLANKYIVNSSPVFGSGQAIKGVLISFDDVTDLEGKKNELAEMILTLRKSRDEVARQNEELNFLANCDPLTKCFNRRSFWNQYTQMWSDCETGRLNLVMVDIDHFKSINDNYGHGTGDEVLKDNGELLRRVTGERGVVCRYGGEEFVILLPNMSLDQAVDVAYEIHKAYGESQLGGLDITASLGVSNTALGVMDMQHLLDQADQCLYAAKRNGRNQVVRYDQCDHELDSLDDSAGTANTVKINYSTVTGLLSALAFKCSRTAEHSVRVADLCVAIGQQMVDKRNLYRLEVCGLLHDIGKIGVPESILNKPGPLTDAEWEIMRKNDEYGVAIVRSAFESDEMASILKFHKEKDTYRGDSDSLLGLSNEVPIESKIITACDAFDAMIGDRVFRDAQPLEAVTQELLRCTPDQFDPEVVELLIKYVSQPGYLTSRMVAVKTSTTAAVSIAGHLENLHDAVASENLRDLKTVVEGLKNEAESGQIEMIADAASRLEMVLNTENAKLSQVMEVAEEVMQLCRSTRSSLVASDGISQTPTSSS